ncbi:hypothetical protein TSOC_014698 [Tetrabaena socialis]|uniref:Uncharacterized protein n=1 Tax=Tetrabaena socialis TaxID=47790 RepID=A0A2J7ZGX4_9CHLO|nr:hypothetical protein TSOC_014698 [Tetrabaena socialis]|eukprot:PNG99520.1 hypothetical protein TSOC_014698 [Tetrabaena socialis]
MLGFQGSCASTAAISPRGPLPPAARRSAPCRAPRPPMLFNPTRAHLASHQHRPRHHRRRLPAAPPARSG